ncbi:MAG: DUF6056 family protein [Acetatifactor sp.]
MKDRTEKAAAGVMLLLLMVGLLPVMYLGRYNHPTGDDYYYGASTHLVWQETGSIAETVAAAAKGVALEYGQWQGTYSALFLMYLPPNIFGNLPYRLVTTVILLLLTAGIFYVCKPLLCSCLKMSVAAWIMISSCLSLLCVETVPSQGESFFWYNGSMYYTGYFALTLFFLGMVSRYLKRQRKGCLAGMLFLAAFLAGGNYVSLLPCLIIMVLLAGWMIWKKKPGVCGVAASAFCMLAGLVVSAAAPGNRVRQDGMWKIPAWKAVTKALVQGVQYAGAWMGLWWLLAALVITPVLLKYMRKCNFRFPCPVIVVGFLYGIFCSMSCPTFYTMNSTGPARAVAVVYYGFLLFSFLAYGYLLGYLQRRWREQKREREECSETAVRSAESGENSATVQKLESNVAGWKTESEKNEEAADKTISKREVLSRGTLLLCVVGIVMVQMGTGTMADCTTGKAFQLLASGEARAYEQEYMERYSLFMDENVQEVVLQPYVNQPDMLYVGDFSPDPQEPTNVKVAQFFGKNSVRVNYEQ